jgi:hypothetical protein
MSGGFVNVSGIDPNDGAKIVFVWCRDPDKGPDDSRLVGSGHVVGPDAPRPPGISVGQFSVTFPLSPGCSADDIVVTDDKTGKDYLPGVTVTPCSAIAGLRSGGTVIPNPAVLADATNASPQSSQTVLARMRS